MVEDPWMKQIPIPKNPKKGIRLPKYESIYNVKVHGLWLRMQYWYVKDSRLFIDCEEHGTGRTILQNETHIKVSASWL